MFLCMSAVSVNADLFTPNRDLVRYYELISGKGAFRVSIYVYQVKDAMPTMDFYDLEMRIECADREFNYIVLNACALNEEAESHSWIPHSNPGRISAVGLGVATFSFGPSEIVTIQTGSARNYMYWKKITMFPKSTEEFKVSWDVPEGMNFTWTLSAEVKLSDEIYGTLWGDTLNFSAA